MYSKDNKKESRRGKKIKKRIEHEIHVTLTDAYIYISNSKRRASAKCIRAIYALDQVLNEFVFILWNIAAQQLVPSRPPTLYAPCITQYPCAWC